MLSESTSARFAGRVAVRRLDGAARRWLRRWRGTRRRRRQLKRELGTGHRGEARAERHRLERARRKNDRRHRRPRRRAHERRQLLRALPAPGRAAGRRRLERGRTEGHHRSVCRSVVRMAAALLRAHQRGAHLSHLRTCRCTFAKSFLHRPDLLYLVCITTKCAIASSAGAHAQQRCCACASAVQSVEWIPKNGIPPRSWDEQISPPFPSF